MDDETIEIVRIPMSVKDESVDDEYNAVLENTFKTCMKIAKNGITQVIHKVTGCERLVLNIKKHNSVYGKGRKDFELYKIRPCVDGTFALLLLDPAIEKVDKFRLRQESLFAFNLRKVISRH